MRSSIKTVATKLRSFPLRSFPLNEGKNFCSTCSAFYGEDAELAIAAEKHLHSRRLEHSINPTVPQHLKQNYTPRLVVCLKISKGYRVYRRKGNLNTGEMNGEADSIQRVKPFC